jgi:hypothetical protein
MGLFYLYLYIFGVRAFIVLLYDIYSFEWLPNDNAFRQFSHCLQTNSKITKRSRHEFCLSPAITLKKLISEIMYFRSQVKAWRASCSIEPLDVTRCRDRVILLHNAVSLHSIACSLCVFMLATYSIKHTYEEPIQFHFSVTFFSKQIYSNSRRTNTQSCLRDFQACFYN